MMAVLHLKLHPVTVKVRETPVPTSKSMHGAMRYPTRFTVFYANRWCRVWQHSDGSRYITHCYVRSRVTALPGDSLL